MPITKQAEKKLRHDRIATKQNALKRLNLRNAVKAMRKNPSKKSLQQAFQLLDKSIKTHTIHKNKAARLKSRLSKLLGSK